MASNANDVSSEVCWFRTSSSVQTSYHSGAVYKNSSFLAQKKEQRKSKMSGDRPKFIIVQSWTETYRQSSVSRWRCRNNIRAYSSRSNRHEWNGCRSSHPERDGNRQSSGGVHTTKNWWMLSWQWQRRWVFTPTWKEFKDLEECIEQI